MTIVLYRLHDGQVVTIEYGRTLARLRVGADSEWRDLAFGTSDVHLCWTGGRISMVHAWFEVSL